ncbi:MAG: hypothetical protein GWP91_01145 [Rhodobacterales bacterium]|nr:hypothetical protein [Rhodobacterales bacterium]
MLLTLSDILFTVFASGLVTLVAGVGIAVLPWRDQELVETEDAFQAVASLSVQWLRQSANPVRAIQTQAAHR